MRLERVVRVAHNLAPNNVALRLETLDESHRPFSKLVACRRSDLVELRLVNQLLDPCLFTGVEEIDFEPPPISPLRVYQAHES